MDSSDKDGLSTDAVHVDAGAGLNVIEMHVAKLGDEVDHIILGAHLEKREERRGEESGRREERERRGREEREREKGRREEKREAGERGRVEGGGDRRKRGREEGKRKERGKRER